MWIIRPRPEAPFLPPKNPFQTFMLALSLLASLPLIAGASGSKVLEQRLDNVTVEVWGWTLMVGSALALLGLWAPRNKRYFGLLLERAGLLLVGGAAFVYSVAIISVASDIGSVRYAACIQIAYALACFWRVFQITNLMRWIQGAISSERDQQSEGE